MSDIDKVLEWGSGRLERHEVDMDAVLSYLYAARSHSADEAGVSDLTAMIQALEAERLLAKRTRERLRSRHEPAA